MLKTKYSKGFEKFWKVWKDVTGQGQGKPEAFKYWKRDKLEGDEDELIRILRLQQAERKRFKDKREWIPEWCFCRKWLNNRRYEYVPEPPKQRRVKTKPLTPEEIEWRKKYGTPEARKAKAEYEKWLESTIEKMTPVTTISPAEFNRRRNEARAKLKDR